MPNAAPHPCPNGHGLVVGRCPQCRRQRDSARPSAQQRGYDHEWMQFSRRWLRAYPWCGQRQGGTFSAEHSRCVQRGERVKAQVTDHIVPLVDGGQHMSPTNSQSLCNRCNVIKAVSG